MKNRILASLIFILSFVSFTFASTLNDSDALQLLNLVETDQDYFDAIDLIKSADNFNGSDLNKSVWSEVSKRLLRVSRHCGLSLKMHFAMTLWTPFSMARRGAK